MNRHTRTIIKVCQGLNKDGNVVAYSVDAGYHIFLFTLKEHKGNVKQTVEESSADIDRIIETGISREGAHLI